MIKSTAAAKPVPCARLNSGSPRGPVSAVGSPAEAAVPGEVAAGEVAGRVAEHRADQHPVERARPVQQLVLQRVVEGQRHDREQNSERQLDRRRHAQVLVTRLPPHVTVGDRARQQLLHRPVEHRHDDEDGGPQERDLAVVVVRQGVAGEREVGVGDEAGDPDQDRQDGRATPVAADRCGGRGHAARR
jgi:hypothetical protein